MLVISETRRGRIGPFGVSREVSEREVALFVAHRMGVDAERESRVGVTENFGNPPDALARLERHGRPRVARGVELQRPNAELLGAPPQAVPDALDVSRLRLGSRLRAEDPLGSLRPASGEPFLAALGQKIEELFGEAFGHRRGSNSFLVSLLDLCPDILVRYEANDRYRFRRIERPVPGADRLVPARVWFVSAGLLIQGGAVGEAEESVAEFALLDGSEEAEFLSALPVPLAKWLAAFEVVVLASKVGVVAVASRRDTRRE
ncbi:MAG: hypothetical protein AAF430_09325 [Myxococcota bacterium]